MVANPLSADTDLPGDTVEIPPAPDEAGPQSFGQLQREHPATKATFDSWLKCLSDFSFNHRDAAEPFIKVKASAGQCVAERDRLLRSLIDTGLTYDKATEFVQRVDAVIEQHMNGGVSPSHR